MTTNDENLPSTGKRALILGRADTVWEEIEAARALGTFDTIIAVKRIGKVYPGCIHHWVSFHPALFPSMIAEREKNGFVPALNYWAPQRVVGVPTNIIPNIGGSSGMLGVQVALHVCEKAVLCGIPLTNTAQYDTGKEWKDALQYREVWEQMFDKMKDRIKSMSGWTQHLLGEPTKEWLGNGEQGTDNVTRPIEEDPVSVQDGNGRRSPQAAGSRNGKLSRKRPV